MFSTRKHLFATLIFLSACIYNDTDPVPSIAIVSIDNNFKGTGFNASVNVLLVQPDGKILVAGWISSFNGVACNRIARLNVDGTLDTTFNATTGLDGPVYALALQPDGKIIAGGIRIHSINGIATSHIRLFENGTVDPSFKPDITFTRTQVNALALQPDGRIIIGGGLLARLNHDGTIDPSFKINSLDGIGIDRYSGFVLCLEIQPDGKIIVGGGANGDKGFQFSRFGRVNSDGTWDATFNIGSGFNSGHIRALTSQPDKKIIVGGAFKTFNGTPANSIVRINSDGSHDATFNAGVAFNGDILCLVLQENGQIVVGGRFTSYNGVSRNHIARINDDGSLDENFDPGTGFNDLVQALAIDRQSKILAGGVFRSFNELPCNLLTRFN